MTDWHILPGLKIDVLIACCRLPVSPQNTECCSRYSASGHSQKFATDLTLSTTQNSHPCKIVTLSLNGNQNLHTPALLTSALQAKDLKFLLTYPKRHFENYVVRIPQGQTSKYDRLAHTPRTQDRCPHRVLPPASESPEY